MSDLMSKQKGYSRIKPPVPFSEKGYYNRVNFRCPFCDTQLIMDIPTKLKEGECDCFTCKSKLKVTKTGGVSMGQEWESDW